MTVVRRFDAGSLLGKAKRTPTGGAIVPARIARSGIQIYQDADGKPVREYRPPEEVFSEESLASLQNAAVTIGHPPSAVSIVNWRSLSHGFAAKADGREETPDGAFVTGELALLSAEVLSGVERRDLIELSAGYETRIDETPGVTPDGQPYDRVQREIRFNHVALGGVGFARAGRNATLRLDGHQTIEENAKMAFRIDGKDVEGEAEVQRAIATLEADRDQLRKRADDMSADLKSSQKALADADAALKIANDKLARRDSEIQEAIDFRSKAVAILGVDFDFAKGTRSDHMRAVVEKAGVVSEIRNDSEDYLAALCDVAFAGVNSEGGFNRRDSGGALKVAELRDFGLELQKKADAAHARASGRTE